MDFDRDLIREVIKSLTQEIAFYLESFVRIHNVDLDVNTKNDSFINGQIWFFYPKEKKGDRELFNVIVFFNPRLDIKSHRLSRGKYIKARLGTITAKTTSPENTKYIEQKLKEFLITIHPSGEDNTFDPDILFNRYATDNVDVALTVF